MKNILFVLTLCAIFILSACQEATPAETETLSSSKTVSTESESSLDSVPDLSSSVSAEENSNSVESEESSAQNPEQDQNSESQSINQTNSSECSSTKQNITKSDDFSSEVEDVTVDETEQPDCHDMCDYLEKNLDKNDYGYLNWQEDCTICIYVVNEQAVKDVVSNYDKPSVEIEYIHPVGTAINRQRRKSGCFNAVLPKNDASSRQRDFMSGTQRRKVFIPASASIGTLSCRTF